MDRSLEQTIKIWKIICITKHWGLGKNENCEYCVSFMSYFYGNEFLENKNKTDFRLK
jgi:hypothetical protein